MYFRIKDDVVYDYSDVKFDEACVYSDLCTKAEYDQHPNKYMIGDVEEQVKVYEYEKKTITVIDYDDEGNPIGEHTEEVDDFGKPIMIEEVDPETGEIILVHKFHYETVIKKGLVLNPDFEQEEEARREAEFNKAFFNTSLGYIRRAVTMQDGSKKDFLSDLVLSIKAGLEQGLDVKILAYDKPPFDKDVEDWTIYQHIVSATPQFIMECLMQTSNDFLPINEE